MKGIVFDLDGTLLDTLADIAAACDGALAEFGYPGRTLAEYKKMVGNGFEKLTERAIGSRPANFREIVARARELYREGMTLKTEPYSGMTETLRALSEAGVRLAVLSNKPDDLSRTLIARYFPDIPFRKVVGAIDGVPLKPDPASLFDMMRGMTLDPGDVGYCGDSDVDMKTAKAAGVAALGAGWGFRGPEELRAAGASAIFTKPAELLSILRSSQR